MLCFNAEENTDDGDTTAHNGDNSGSNNTNCGGINEEIFKKKIKNGKEKVSLTQHVKEPAKERNG